MNPREAGADCRARGGVADDCPYSVNSPDGVQWREGFREASDPESLTTT